MSNWAITELGIPFILGIVDAENKGSCRVLEKVGYNLIDEKEKSVFNKSCITRTYRLNKCSKYCFYKT